MNHFFVHFDLIGLSGQTIRELFDRPRYLQQPVRYTKIVAPLAGKTPPHETPDLTTTMYIKSLVVDAVRNMVIELPSTQRQQFQRLAAGSHAFAELQQHIDHHLSERLDNQSLAERMNMSKSHFVRSFHAAVGQTPAAYVQDRRISAAAERLSFTDDSLETIAAHTGFANRFYLTRVFTRLMGIPPAAYRKAVR